MTPYLALLAFVVIGVVSLVALFGGADRIEDVDLTDESGAKVLELRPVSREPDDDAPWGGWAG